MSIIVSKKGVVPASLVGKSCFGKEHNLQEYIYQHPEAIPIYDIQEGKRLLVVAREFETQSFEVRSYDPRPPNLPGATLALWSAVPR